jgi:AcrR family transcriptional regulator
MPLAKRRAPAPRAARQLRAERREQLVTLGIEQFGRAPYDDVSIDAIAESAGISKGLLYHYFPTKKAFYAACVRAAAADLVRRTEPAGHRCGGGGGGGGGEGRERGEPADLPPFEELRAALDAYLEYARAHAAAYTTLMRSGVGVDREIARIVDETRELFIARLTSKIWPDDDAVAAARGAAPAASHPLALPRTALVKVALRGWVGFCEAVSLAWLADMDELGARAPTQRQVRDLLDKALVAIATVAAAAPAPTP